MALFRSGTGSMAAGQDEPAMTHSQLPAGTASEAQQTPQPVAENADSALAELFHRLDRIAAQVAGLARDDRCPSTATECLAQLQELAQGQAQLKGSLADLESRVTECLRVQSALAEQLCPSASAEDDREAAQDAASADAGSPGEDVQETLGRWHSVLFGDLAEDPALEDERAALITGLIDRDPAALALIGHWLVFHAAPDAQKPQLLKDVGEAFYRWRPKPPYEACLLEQALASSLERACEAAGIRRKIDVVALGGRFNAAYHRANEKGVEIAEVDGWLILREDGSVYQKAAVVVR